jgi:HPt (histidine-containing phosphotransfer) domain-containing protein
MPELPVIDLPTLSELSRYCDASMMGVILDAFLTSAPQLLAEAEQGQAEGHLDRVARAIHTLRSGLGSLGANRMAPLAANLEATARAGQAAESAALLAQLQAEYVAVRELLIAVRDDPARYLNATPEP